MSACASKRRRRAPGSRLRNQRDTLRPLGLAAIAVVAIGTFNAHPRPALHGSGLGVAFALAVFAGSLAVAIRNWFVARDIEVQAAVIAAIGAAWVALAALQPTGPASIAVGVAVWMAVTRLPGQRCNRARRRHDARPRCRVRVRGQHLLGVLASTLLCVMFGLIAYFLKQARESQDRTEVLLAQLEDAREEQTRAAAVAERGGSRASCTTFSRTRSPGPLSSCRERGCSPTATTPNRRCAPRSTAPVSW